ncbi:MAG: hypothetical protein CMM41_08090 [Rhodospirillaceae bacterium]|nr:hypothetical protein [Rhodospirillaceae bacterium]MBC27155.1 hypothetical protein [Rhodospirillaceae bacterium]|tara:strand:- start:1449 stop:2573 length:1125 start_codon:yes stop_codon:yes gene_type:complete
MSIFDGGSIGSSGLVGTLPTAATGLFAVLPDAAAARGLQSAARASAAVARDKALDLDARSIEAKARTAKKEAQNLGRITNKLNRAVKTIEKALDRLTEIKTNISDMRRQIVTASDASVSIDERRVFGDRFDRFLGDLNIRIKGAGFLGTNIIGTSIRDDFDPDQVNYQIKPDSPENKTLEGIFSQSDFFITDGNGDDFYPDIYGSILTKFPNPAAEDGKVVYHDDSVNYNNNTGEISLTHSGEGTPYLQGTLERKGLGILFSFLYNNFEDDGSLETALSDVDAASATLRFNIGFLEGELAKVRSAQTLVEGKIRERFDFAAGVEAKAMSEKNRAAIVEQRQDLLFQATVQNTLAFNSQGGALTLTSPSVFDLSI